MDSDIIVREHLLSLLKGDNAHMTFKDATANFPEKAMNTTFPNGTYTPWDLLEHIRITQWDILNFIQNPNYKEMSWPNDYWPPKDKKATKKDWEDTLKQFEKDSKELGKIVSDSKIDLYAKISHGSGQTVFREILLVADHNAYHIGEFAIIRQVMGTWGKDHE